MVDDVLGHVEPALEHERECRKVGRMGEQGRTEAACHRHLRFEVSLAQDRVIMATVGISTVWLAKRPAGTKYCPSSMTCELRE